MSRLSSHLVCSFTLILLFSTAAFAQKSHSVWSDNKPLLIRDGQNNKEYKIIKKGDAIFAWTQATTRSYAHALGIVDPTLSYDFALVTATGSDADTISGRWIIRRNGVIVCNNCLGRAYGLSQPASAANYFKIYVGTPTAYAEKWHYSGYITSRFDF